MKKLIERMDPQLVARVPNPKAPEDNAAIEDAVDSNLAELISNDDGVKNG